MSGLIRDNFAPYIYADPVINRSILSTGSLGTYSELIAAAAFMAEGYEVAFPHGAQRFWDLVVCREGVWSKVQVKTLKTVRHLVEPVISLKYRAMRGMTKRVDRPYLASEVDLVVMVHPETGSLWKIPSVEFDGKIKLKLKKAYIWRGAIEPAATPVPNPLPYRPLIQESLIAVRREMKSKLPADRPEWMSLATWVAIGAWCGGAGYGTIGKELSISASAVRERIVRGLHRLALFPFPDSLKFRTKRSGVAQETAAAQMLTAELV